MTETVTPELTTPPASVPAPAPSWQTVVYHPAVHAVVADSDLSLSYSGGCGVLSLAVAATPHDTAAAMRHGDDNAFGATFQDRVKELLAAAPEFWRYARLRDQVAGVEVELRQLERDLQRSRLDASDAEVRLAGVTLAESITRFTAEQSSLSARIASATSGLKNLRQRLEDASAAAEAAAERIARQVANQSTAEARQAFRAELQEFLAAASPGLTRLQQHLEILRAGFNTFAATATATALLRQDDVIAAIRANNVEPPAAAPRPALPPTPPAAPLRSPFEVTTEETNFGPAAMRQVEERAKQQAVDVMLDDAGDQEDAGDFLDDDAMSRERA